MPIPFAYQNIFLADDDDDDRFLLANALRHVVPNVRLSEYASGSELLDALESDRPELLFLDLDMPHPHGLQCLTAIRNEERLRELPIVVVSSTSRPGNIQAAYEMGADLFLVKPSTFSRLVTDIESILSLDWEHREAVKQGFFRDGKYVALL